MGSTALLAGTAMQAGSKVYGGIRAKQADDQSAALLSEEAGQSVASGIQGAVMDRRKATYVASSARARIAGSGLATTGTSAIDTAALIRGQGEYNALTSLYQGQDRALELSVRAQGLQDEGNASETAGFLSGASSAISGGQSFYSKYGT